MLHKRRRAANKVTRVCALAKWTALITLCVIIQRVGQGWTGPPNYTATVLLAITTYNHLNYTSGALQSLLANSDDFDVLIIDDTSEDDTVAFARSLGFAVMELHTPSGTTYAWNIAYKFAMRHKYNMLFLANNDILLPSGAMLQMTQELNNREVGIVVPLTTQRGAGFNPAQSISNVKLLSKGQPFHFNMEQITESEKSYSAIQDTLSNAEVSFMIPPPNDRFAGFFFGIKTDKCLQFSRHNLINPKLKIFGQELDLMRRARQCYERPVSVVSKAFVHHFKSVTVGASGYRVGFWRKDFDLVSTHHKGNGKISSHNMVATVKEANLVFILPKATRPSLALVRTRARELGQTLSLACGAHVQFWDEPSRWYDVRSVDILVILSEDYELSKMKHAKITLTRVFWLSNGSANGEIRKHLGHFDAIIFASARLKRSITAHKVFITCFTRCPLNIKMLPYRKTMHACVHDFSRRPMNSSFADEQLISCLDERCFH